MSSLIAFSLLLGIIPRGFTIFLIARSVNIYRAHHTLRASKRKKIWVERRGRKAEKGKEKG